MDERRSALQPPSADRLHLRYLSTKIFPTYVIFRQHLTHSFRLSETMRNYQYNVMQSRTWLCDELSVVVVCFIRTIIVNVASRCQLYGHVPKPFYRIDVMLSPITLPSSYALAVLNTVHLFPHKDVTEFCKVLILSDTQTSELL